VPIIAKKGNCYDYYIMHMTLFFIGISFIAAPLIVVMIVVMAVLPVIVIVGLKTWQTLSFL
jgi:hypothetical protein